MRCPNCGKENADDAKFCQMCARALAPSYIAPDLVVQRTQAPKSESHTLAIVVGIVVLLVVVGAIAVMIIATAPKADLRADLSYSAANDLPGLIGSGTIIVYGTIYNYGDKMGDGTVQLHIYDGYEWHDYSSPTGVVPANGSVNFFWDGDFEHMYEDAVIVQHTITMG